MIKTQELWGLQDSGVKYTMDKNSYYALSNDEDEPILLLSSL